MWKSRVQSTSSGSKTSGQTKSTNLQHLSPFASHSTAESVASPSTISPKTGNGLPSGVRYIRQNPSSVCRPVTVRPKATTVTKKRDKSPEKNLRFADPLQCTRKHEKTESTKTVPKTRARSTSGDRNLVRPVISAEPSPTECKRFSSHTNKVVATSPATRQTSPIFSTVDFGGDTKRNSTIRQSPTVEQNPISKKNPTVDQIPITRKSPTVEQMTTSRKSPTVEQIPITRKNQNVEHIPNYRSDDYNDLTQVLNSKSTHDRQPVIKTEIKTPNGTVLKRSSAVTTKTGNNGAIHRNTVSFPMQSSNDRNVEQSRLSVNVNVAVGLDGYDNRLSHFVDQNYTNPLDTEYEAISAGEDEVEWAPHIGKGFALNVAVRLRPFVQSEINSKNDIPVLEMNGSTVRVINSDNDVYNRQEFGFDVCLNSSDRDLFEFADQDLVFKKMGQPLLERALEGYNVCLFAYGQTGSGKSYTMSGTDNNPGIIPRFVHELYRRMSGLTEVLFAVEVSYCEIYNEKIYDLLSDDKNYDKKVLRIREHPQTGPYVENLTQHNVENFEEVMRFLRNGNRRRATASTAANADSSRSHSIFTIVLSQLKSNSDEMGLDVSCSCGSRINLIDLAGSERIGHSGTSGERLKEGSLINKSLLNLGKVISKLADYSTNRVKSGHIPYRDSALTWLLKESLGGNSQTSMIATISPAKCHLEETLSTLRYAATARRIVNFVHINEDPKTKKIRELMEVIADLKAKQRTQAIDPKDNDVPKEVPTNSSDGSKNSSFESQNSQKTTVEKVTIGTNTSFVADRRTSTKGTDTSFSFPAVEDKGKKKTATIATNTSFVKPSKSTATETRPPPKPKTVSKATEMSFIETEHMDHSTNTSFVELPSPLDLLRFKRLEEQEKKLLEDIRRHREKIMQEVTAKVESWTPYGSGRSQNGEASGSDSLSYYDAQEVIENESIHSNHTYVVSLDTVERVSHSVTKDVKQSSDTQSTKKKDKKKKKDKTDANEWRTEDNNKTEPKTHDWTQEPNQTESVINLDYNKQSTEEQNTCDDWLQEDIKTYEDKADNECNNWSVDVNDNQTEDKVTTNAETNDWGTDTNQQQSNDWQTGGVNDWRTDDKNDNEDKGNEWLQNDDQTTGQTQSEGKAGNDWNDGNQWSEEPKKSNEKPDKQSSRKKSNKKKDKKNKKKEKTEDNDWGTDINNKTEEKANEWGAEEQAKDDWNEESAQNKENNECNDQNTDWQTDGDTNWNTDSANKGQDNQEDSGGWDDQPNDGQTADDNQFDWGTDTTDTTVIDTNVVKQESTDWGDGDVNDDNW